MHIDDNDQDDVAADAAVRRPPTSSATDPSLDFSTLAGAVDAVSDHLILLAEGTGNRIEAMIAELECLPAVAARSYGDGVVDATVEDIASQLDQVARTAPELAQLVRALVDLRRDELTARRGGGGEPSGR